MDMVEVDKNNLRTIEITINYHELLMKYDDTSVYKKYDLPEGFHYEFYKPGDEEEWAQHNFHRYLPAHVPHHRQHLYRPEAGQWKHQGHVQGHRI